MVENVEKAKKGNTMGFSVSGAPIWLCGKLNEESIKYNNGCYWVTLSTWFRKAEAYDALFSNMQVIIPPPDMEEEQVKEEIKVENEKPIVNLMGGHRGE